MKIWIIKKIVDLTNMPAPIPPEMNYGEQKATEFGLKPGINAHLLASRSSIRGVCATERLTIRRQ